MGVLDLGSHSLVICRIVETHVSENCITAGKPDISKARTFAYTMSEYRAPGETIAKAFNVGKELKAK